MRLAAMAAAITVAMPAMAAAQGTPVASCKVSEPADWVNRQALWFDDSKHGWTNDTLRAALLTAAGLPDPLGARATQPGVRVEGRERSLGATAGEMTEQLRKLASTRGSAWPTRSVVGAAGAHAVFMLAQNDTALGRAALRRLMEAGPDESLGADVATLEDQQRLLRGRKQLYGTQFRIEGGTVVLSPMEDSAHADLRREGAGLPPLQHGLCLAKSR
jgi:hypothetical protein